VPTPAELVGRFVQFVGDVLGASSLRLGIGPTLVVLAILLVFLQLVARPISRWTTTDAGGLAGIGRAMALAAEAGSDAVVSLGTAGIGRATDALARLQTLAALPVLGHVGRAAARSGVPLRVLTNDPLTAIIAGSALNAAHESTGTTERLGRSRVVMVGEGRPAAAGLVMTTRARPTAAIAMGSLREEATLHLEGLRHRAGSLSSGTAEASQAPSVMLAAGGSLIGPELLQAPADLQADVYERTTVIAANRLIVAALVIIVVGSVLSLAGVIDPDDLLLGVGRR
jgi:hypothetical protein